MSRKLSCPSISGFVPQSEVVAWLHAGDFSEAGVCLGCLRNEISHTRQLEGGCLAPRTDNSKDGKRALQRNERSLRPKTSGARLRCTRQDHDGVVAATVFIWLRVRRMHVEDSGSTTPSRSDHAVP